MNIAKLAVRVVVGVGEMVAARVWVGSYYSGGKFCVCLRARGSGDLFGSARC